jgi:hypothetical protein
VIPARAASTPRFFMVAPFEHHMARTKLCQAPPIIDSLICRTNQALGGVRMVRDRKIRTTTNRLANDYAPICSAKSMLTVLVEVSPTNHQGDYVLAGLIGQDKGVRMELLGHVAVELWRVRRSSRRYNYGLRRTCRQNRPSLSHVLCRCYNGCAPDDQVPVTRSPSMGTIGNFTGYPTQYRDLGRAR